MAHRDATVHRPVGGDDVLACYVPGCSKPVRAAGLCNTCYHRWYRGRGDATPRCIVKGCSEPVYARGLCFAHYVEAFGSADIDAPQADTGDDGRDWTDEHCPMPWWVQP